MIGWLHDQSVIVTPPENVNWPLLLKRNQEYTIRLFSGTSAYAFATHVLLILDRPYEQVHLSYSAEVLSAPVRRVERLKVDVAAEVEAGTDEVIRKAEIIDASVLGARIRVADFGNVGDSIKVSFRLTAGGKEWPVSLSSIIRTISRPLTIRMGSDSNGGVYETPEMLIPVFSFGVLTDERPRISPS